MILRVNASLSFYFQRTRQGSFRRQSLLSVLQDVDLNESLMALTTDTMLLNALKGGGQGAAEVETAAHPTTTTAGFFPNTSTSGTPSSPPPFMPANTVPLYSSGGKSCPELYLLLLTIECQKP